MKFIRRIALAALAFSLLLPVASAAPSDFKVVVHPSNPVESLSRATLERMFLKRTRTWQHGEPVRVVDQSTTSKARVAFTKAVLRRSVTAVGLFWNQQIFSGRGVPPLSKKTDGEVVQYVGNTANAIGYVSGNASTQGVKVIEITP